MQTTLLEAIGQAQIELSSGNKPFGHVLDLISKYKANIERDVEDINYAIVYAYGLRLIESLEIANKKVALGELPEFEIEQLETVRSITLMHGPFILSSKDGRELVTQAERYQRTPNEERVFQENIEQFGEKLTAHKDIVNPDTADFILEISQKNTDLMQYERDYLFKKGMVKNSVIVLSAGAMIYAASLVPTFGPVLAISIGLVLPHALRSSKPFKEISDPMTKKIDQISQSKFMEEFPAEQLRKIKDFVLENRELLGHLELPRFTALTVRFEAMLGE